MCRQERAASCPWSSCPHRSRADQCTPPVYGAFFVKRFQSGASFLISFFVRPGAPFLRPNPQYCEAGARRSCQGWPSPNLAAYSALARPHLDSFEHDGPLGAVGMTIRGKPAFRARINRATTLYPVGPGPEP